jgi:hypothetical protein
MLSENDTEAQLVPPIVKVPPAELQSIKFDASVPHFIPPPSKSICEVPAPNMLSFFVAIPSVVSDETPAPITSGTAFASSRGDITPVVVKAPVNVVALIVSLKITPVQLVPPIVRVPAVVVSMLFALRAPHDMPPVSKSICEVAAPSIVTFFVAIPSWVSDERPFPITRGTAFASTAGVDTAVVVKAPVNVTAPTVSLNVTPEQVVPPIVRVPTVVVSMLFAVRAPHFTVPVSRSIFEVAAPFIVNTRAAAPIFKAPLEEAPAARLTTVELVAPFARYNVPDAEPP